MADLRVRNLTKRFPGVTALAGVDLEVADGQCLAIVGPSGCGKTTLLRVIAGLERATSGTVDIDGERVDRMPPHRRGVAMMFQDYSLYPHMSVRQNLAFPLRMAGTSRSAIDRAINETTALLGLEGELDRRPGELSGGEQQRVALGRVVIRRPRCALLDEPLSNLDARLREELRGELKALLSKLGITCVFVTHDQQEAAAVGDRLAVMVAGRIHQIGSPTSVLAKPADRTVADFLGVTIQADAAAPAER